VGTTEARIAALEIASEGHDVMVNTLEQSIADLRDDMNRRFDQVDSKFDQVDRRFQGVDARFDQVDARFGQIDRRFEGVDARFLGIEARLTALDQKVDRRFDTLDGRIATEIGGLRRDMTVQLRWTVGLMFTGFVSIAAVIVTAIGTR